MLPLFILSHRMYEMATLVLYVHDVLMALSFQNSLFVIVQKKFYPYFHYKVLSNGNISSESKSNN